LEKKIKIFTIGDHPLSPSGVGTQSRYIIEGLLNTGKYQVISFGGAVGHPDHTPQKTDQYKDDWVIYPVDGYGSQDQVRSVIRTHKPDMLWFMTDPRFYVWLWEIEHEIRPLIPMVYYHVWDNFPPPQFNRPFYLSNDVIATISKVTDEVVGIVAPEVRKQYVPHAVDTNIFKKATPEVVEEFRKQNLSQIGKDKVVFFWNNRNARRKMSGSVLWWFKEFLDEVGHDKAMLLMHTDPRDVHGPNLEHVVKELGLDRNQVLFSAGKYPAEMLALLYNMADCTINVADAEGFGLATLESLSCETPVIVSMTGGLQQQVTDGEKWFGIGIEPSSKAVIGSQDVPYIYEDRINREDFLNALRKFVNMSSEEREALGKAGREYVLKEYNLEKYTERWDALMTNIYETCGSWENRKGYNNWELIAL